MLNKHCYLPPLVDNEPLVKRTVELKHQILEELFQWTIVTIDQDDFLASSDKEKYINDRIVIEAVGENQEVKL